MPPSTIEIDTRLGLDPLAVVLENGKGIAITPARVMIGIGIVGAGGLMADGAVAHAHEQTPDTIDTPYVVIVDEGSNVEEQMEKEGYIKKEINDDLLRHGISLDEGMTLQVLAGSSWKIDPKTVAERESRLNGSVTISIEEDGPTFWQQLDDLKLSDTDTVVEILGNNGRDLDWATRAKPGASIVVDSKYLLDDTQTPDITSEEPETVQLTLQADSIIEDLKNRDVEDATVVGIEAVGLSGMTDEESREMHLGDTYNVRTSSLPLSVVESASPVSEAPTADPDEPIIVTLEKPGDTLSERLEELGSDNPVVDAQETLDSIGLSSEDAENHPVGFEYSVPDGIELLLTEVPVDAPVDTPPETPIDTPPVDTPPETPIDALTEAEPSVTAYKMLAERVAVNGGFLDKQSAQEIWHVLKTSTSHPEKSEDFQNPEMFIKTPDPSVDFPYVVHPRTCTTELYAKPAGIFSAMVNVATLEYLLMDPQWAKYRNMVIELGDLVSGDHKTHGHGDKGDFRSRIITTIGSENPDGALLNTKSPNYDQEFTIQFLVLLGQTISPNGDRLYNHIEFQDNFVIKEVNKRLGFRLMSYVEGHSEHTHQDTDVEGETEDGIQGTPNTTGQCTFAFVDADQALIDAVNERRAGYPVEETPPTEEPPVETPPADESPTEEPPEQELPTQEQLIAAAWEMSADEYIDKYNNGEKYIVQLQNGSKAVEVPSEVQRAVDIVWRLENGVSQDTVINALTVSLAESGLNNSAMNQSTGDRCLFQINKINREFIEGLNSRNGWNIDYDNLQNDIVGCARVAFALYQSDLDFEYSKEYVDEYVDRFGLKLPPEMYRTLTQENPTSLGFRAWLMSAKNHGLY